MNTIQKIQRIFHTDRWWGKTIFVALVYSLFWIIFYGGLFLIPDDFYNNYIPGFVTLFYVIIFLPAISFLLIKLFKNIFLGGRYFYFIHISFIIISICIFWIVFLISAYNNYNIQFL